MADTFAVISNKRNTKNKLKSKEKNSSKKRKSIKKISTSKVVSSVVISPDDIEVLPPLNSWELRSNMLSSVRWQAVQEDREKRRLAWKYELPFMIAVVIQKRNVFYHASDIRGKLRLSLCMGLCGFKGKEKQAFLAVVTGATIFFNILMTHGIQHLFFIYRNSSYLRHAVRKGWRLFRKLNRKKIKKYSPVLTEVYNQIQKIKIRKKKLRLRKKLFRSIISSKLLLKNKKNFEIVKSIARYKLGLNRNKVSTLWQEGSSQDFINMGTRVSGGLIKCKLQFNGCRRKKKKRRY